MNNYTYPDSQRFLTSVNYEHEDTTVSVHNTTHTYRSTPDVSMVRFAFVAFGFTLLFPALTLFLLHVHLKKSSSLPPIWAQTNNSVELVATGTNGRHTKNGPTSGNKKPFTSAYNRIFFICLMLAFFVFYMAMEFISRGFLTSFTAKFLNWSTRNSTLINTVLSGCHFAGRVIGIPLSAILRPRSVLAINFSLMLAASFLLLFPRWHDGVLVWLAAGLLGYGLSTTFPGESANL